MSYDQALLQACENGHHDLIRALVSAGADVNTYDIWSYSDNSTLKAAIENRHVTCIKILISLGADVNQSGGNGWTAVFGAVKAFKDNIEVLQLLIESGADVNKSARSIFRIRESPLEYACTRGYADAANTLLQAGANVNVNVENGTGPLILASTNGRKAIVDLLIKFTDDKNIKLLGVDTALVRASSGGYIQIVKTIADIGADVNSVVSSETALVGSVAHGHAENVEFLVKAGADVKTKSKDGNTVLGIAARNGQVECVEVLLNAGGDVNHIDKYGWPIIIVAASKGHTLCMNYLSNVQNIFTRCILYHSIGSHDDRLHFFKYKRSWIKKHVEGNNVSLYKQWQDLLEEKGNKLTPTASHTKCVKLLTKYGADVNLTTNGWTPLMVACLDGHKDIVEILLESGADVNATSEIGWTPLLAAVLGDQYDCAETLIEAGADVNIDVAFRYAALNHKKNALGFAVDIAEYSINMVKLLLLSGMQLLGLKMARKENRKIIRLLIAAGYSNPKREDIFQRPKKTPLATSLHLSDICRAAIRKRLFELKPLKNLVYKVHRLRLPSLLEKYLLFGVSLNCIANHAKETMCRFGKTR